MEANRRSRWPSKPERGYWLIRFSAAGLIVGFVGGLVLSGGLILLGVLSAFIVAGLFAGIGAAIDAPKWAGGGALVGLFLSMLASIALYFRFSANPEQGLPLWWPLVGLVALCTLGGSFLGALVGVLFVGLEVGEFSLTVLYATIGCVAGLACLLTTIALIVID